MRTIPLLAALAVLGSAVPAAAFGPATTAAQPQRVLVGPLDEPMVCIPGHRLGECDRMRVIRGDSNESEERITRLHSNDDSPTERPKPQPRGRG